MSREISRAWSVLVFLVLLWLPGNLLIETKHESRENCWKELVIMCVRDNAVCHPGRRDGRGEKGSDCGNMLRGEPIGFTDRLWGVWDRGETENSSMLRRCQKLKREDAVRIHLQVHNYHKSGWSREGGRVSESGGWGRWQDGGQYWELSASR